MKIKNFSLILAAGLSVTALSGCGIYQKYDAKNIDSQLVKEYAEALKAQDDSLTFGNLSWRAVFTDPALADLIERALAANKDLRNAKLNVDIAHAQLKGAKLSYLPSLAFAPNGAGAKYADNDFSWTYQLPLAVNWEVDIFGKLLNSKRGAQMAELQSKAYEQAVRSQIIAGVAQCYYSIGALEAQLKLSRETSELWKESVQVMRNLKEAGRLREDAVVQSLAQYYSIEASITDIEVSLHEANNTLSLLLNEMPQKWTISAESMLNVPVMKRAAIPMSELAVRPDVRASEMALASAFYSTASARAAFYPSLNITANGGFTNLLGGFVKNPGDWFVQLAGSLTAPIFSRGQNIARLEAAKAQQQQALNNFEYTLMSAAADVSSAMTVYEKSIQKQQWLELQVENLSKAAEITNELLMFDGSTTYLEVLTAQKNLLAAQTAQITTNLTTARSIINLYQNLGGGR
ncbi:MAG: TolC family protein [Duncaniella sp.]|uniref:TolC family protein n=1 Tax=Duncaniella sp. TaxID=2518496 RepID=UPI0019B51D5C|nr:TolC family protein [Duncaniella sp.]MBD5334386.1 TolC family protein [Bacteroides sp.]MDE6090805.1 TolC family protein [Duncaniella sp.]